MAANLKMIDKLFQLVQKMKSITQDANHINNNGNKKWNYKCAHCGSLKDKGGDSKCCELAENAANRLKDWKSRIKEWQCVGPDIKKHMWQPGKDSYDKTM